MALMVAMSGWVAPAAAQGQEQEQESTPTILLYGDSLLAGYGLPPEQGFAAQLQAAMDAAGIAATLVNASVSGDTTADGLARLDWTLAQTPDAVILGLGANDMLQGLPPATTRNNLEILLERFTALDVPVLLLGMLADRGLGADYVSRFDAIYPELAAQYDVALYPFFLEGVALDPALNQPDGIHPNADGVDVIVDQLLPHIADLLDRID